MNTSARGPRIGLRREVAIVLPVVMMLLVVLSTYILYSYRQGLELLVEARQADALRLASNLAESIASGHIDSVAELRQRAAGFEHLALVTETGTSVLEVGVILSGSPLSGFAVSAIDQPIAIGPTAENPSVTALAPTWWRGARHFIRVDLAGNELAFQRQRVGSLTWVVLPINAALLILVLLFLRHLLAPYDKLMATARKMQSAGDEVEDEVTFLISSFEKAVQTLEAREPEADDLATLELALGPSLESGFLLLGRDGEVLSLNPVGSELLGCESPAAGVAIGKLLAPYPKLDSLIAEAIKKNTSIQRHEVEIETPDRPLTLGLSVHPLRRDAGDVRGYLVLFADLTETRRQAEEERLSISLAQVGELAAGVAHEMRNSLSTFRGYLTLVERAPEEDAITDYLSELRRETDHLHRVLEDFLSFARPETTQSELLNLETIVRRAAVDPALDGTEVVIDAGVQLPVLGDPQLLERAVRNLLHNAQQAHQKKGVDESLLVRTSLNNNQATVEILDRGAGIAPEVRERLFEPFVTGRPDGVGLGLSIARRIVDLHGGQIRLDDRPGGGTVVSLSFPLAPAT